ncbi:hypothetical protein GGF44_004983, partial [Coemansia sp. RSA 1694]
RNEEPEPRSLKIEIAPITIVRARQAGLSKERSNELQSTASTRSQLYQIKRIEALCKAQGVLQDLDIVVSINGRLARTLEDFDVQFTSQSLEMVVLRDSQEHTLQVETTESKQEVERVVCWAGALFHAPHKTVLQQSTAVPSGVYCADVVSSSHSFAYGMAEGHWVTHVNGVATPDIDSFERAVNACQDDVFVRVKVVSAKSKPNVLTIKTCHHYWPTTTLVKDREAVEGWRYRQYAGRFQPAKQSYFADVAAKDAAVKRPTVADKACQWVVENQISWSAGLLAVIHGYDYLFAGGNSKLVHLQHPIPNDAQGRYSRGEKDAFFILHWAIAFTLIRATIMYKVLEPFAKWYGVKSVRKITRFAEQGWLTIYYILSNATGLY